MSAGINESESEWLSVARYQLTMAREQAQTPPPLSSLSINLMQDAVESMLALAAEHLHAPVKNNPDFLAIFDAVTAKLDANSEVLGHRSAMAALNKARINFKHHGNSPADTTIQRHLIRAEEFATSLVMEVFGVTLEDISLLLFVRCAKARDYLSEADRQWPANPEEATEALRLAYDELVSDFEKRKAWRPGKTLFSTKPSFMPSKSDIKKSGKVIEKLYEWVTNVDEYVRSLALGVDMRQFAYFDAHMPTISRALGGNHIVNHRSGVEVTDEIFRRCFKFVVDTALAFGADDFDFDHWSARESLREAQVTATTSQE